MPQYRLGRKARKTDTRTLQLAKYFTPEIPAPPASVDWSKGITSWGSFLNNTLGDCTIAGGLHAIQVWSANASTEASLTDAEALQYYEDWDGYNPNNPATDQGGIELDVLTDWKQQGLAGHALDAFAEVQPAHINDVKQTISLFGGTYIGLALPQSAQAQVGSLWDVTYGPEGEPGTWGGHCVFVVGYDANGLTCITWGALQRMTWDFWLEYVDESYALISPDWIEKAGKTPNGFDLAQLQADLALIS